MLSRKRISNKYIKKPLSFLSGL